MRTATSTTLRRSAIRRPTSRSATSRDNLKAAVAGETHEYTDMYPGMAKAARGEGLRGNRRLVRDAREGRAFARQPLPEGAGRARRLTPAARQLTLREGNLEAPTRHPVDWRNPEFYDEAALYREQERIFDICHGCRRCVSLCGAFPTLFDLIDASAIDGDRRRRQGRLPESRRPVLPLRHLLHDEVPVRSAAPVERRFSAPDAAGEGAEVSQRRRLAGATGC